MDLDLPRRLGRRVLLKLAARGGMGDVYLAATTGIEGAERPCIVKTVRRDHVHDGSFLARFLDEARVQAQLQHPGVAQVLEAANEEDGPYTVVEYVEGRSLCDVRQRALQTAIPVGWANGVAIAIEIAQALAHVHERSGPDGSPLGIVHRDLSPQNVMVAYTGEVKLIDFGTARGHNRRCHTVAGVVFAKPGYVAPEVARQQMGDARIDLYALGIILWELCAGRRFLTTDPQCHLDHVAAGRLVIPPVAEACGAPRELDEVIANLTKNDPDERYPRAALAVADLAKLLARAPAAEASERGVRARTAFLMRALWPHEPARARAEFVRLVHEARQALGSGEAGDKGRESPPATAASTVQEDASRLPGTPYRLVRSVGEGSSGVVWEAEHVELGRRVAIKVLSAELSGSRASLERFRGEARATAALSHPNLVQILDFGRALDGRVFLVMELLRGETLAERLHRAPMTVVEATRIAIQACVALEATHGAGLVHRDIKPQNLMLTPTLPTGGIIVKLLDFGVATAPRCARIAHIKDDARMNEDARIKERALRGFAIFGTPEYMAPEQVGGEGIDQRADIYALGCVLYEMLVGAPPFAGSLGGLGKHLRETPEPLPVRTRSGLLPESLRRTVMRAIATDPRGRFESARQMRSALEKTLITRSRHERAAPRLAAVALLAAVGCLAAGVSAHWTRKLSTLEVEPAAALSASSSVTPRTDIAGVTTTTATATPSATLTVPAPPSTSAAVSVPKAGPPDRNSAAARRALSLPSRRL
jgi:serine/threonine-protein kinase